MKTNGKSISERLRDTDAITEAMAEAIRETVREHKLLGFPIVVYQDGKVVEIPPEQIELDEPTTNGASAS